MKTTTAGRKKTRVVRIMAGNSRYTSPKMTAAKAERIAAEARKAGQIEGKAITSVTILPISQDFLNSLALS